MAEDDAEKSQPQSTLTIMEKLIGIAVAGVTAWTAYQSSAVKDSVAIQGLALDGVRAEMAKSADDRETRKLNHDITLKIFEEVKDIYKTPNQTPDQVLNRLLSVSALVEAVPQSDVRTALAGAVKAAVENVAATMPKPTEEIRQKTEAVKSRIDVTVFRADQNDTVASEPKNEKLLANAAAKSNIDAPHWSNFDFDFFWCETSSRPEAAKRAAELAATLRSLDPNASGRWRVRKLPSEINSKPGYQVKGYKIHATSDEEVKIANTLKSILMRQSIPSSGDVFEIRKIQFDSPWYLSVFFCPTGAPPQ